MITAMGINQVPEQQSDLPVGMAKVIFHATLI